MLAKPHRENENRLVALENLRVLDSGEEKIYNDMVGLTAELCDAPICLISLVDKDRQWFKSKVGLDFCETKIENSICSHAVSQDAFLEIEDTHLDDRTKDNPLCHGKRPIRFYAGALLRTLDGWPLGTLCVLDYRPRRLTALQRRILKVNAKSVTRHLEFTQVLLGNAALSWQEGAWQEDATGASEIFKKETEETRRLFETLTPREKEVMQLIAGRSGNLSSKQIARELDISHRTVDHHRAKILMKMNAGSVAEIIAVSLKAGLFD